MESLLHEKFASWKIKNYFLKNPSHINKISYMIPEIWLPNLW